MNDNDHMPCPYCRERIARGASLCRHCDRGIDPAQFAPCSSCHEMIRKQATRCRFCQTKLEERLESKPEQPILKLEKEPPAPPVIRTNFFGFGKKQPAKDNSQPASPQSGGTASYGEGVRAQVFEVIVRQAMAGAPWREICAGPMNINNITPEEVENEVAKRRNDFFVPPHPPDYSKSSDPTERDVEFGRLIHRLMRIADDIAVTDSRALRMTLAEELRTAAKELEAARVNSLDTLRKFLEEKKLAKEDLDKELLGFTSKYDAILDLVNDRDRQIEELREELKKLRKQLAEENSDEDEESSDS